MTPQIPGYLLSFKLIVRTLVTIIALGLIWLGCRAHAGVGEVVLPSKERLMRVPRQAKFGAAKMSEVLLGVEADMH